MDPKLAVLSSLLVAVLVELANGQGTSHTHGNTHGNTHGYGNTHGNTHGHSTGYGNTHGNTHGNSHGSVYSGNSHSISHAHNSHDENTHTFGPVKLSQIIPGHYGHFGHNLGHNFGHNLGHSFGHSIGHGFHGNNRGITVTRSVTEDHDDHHSGILGHSLVGHGLR